VTRLALAALALVAVGCGAGRVPPARPTRVLYDDLRRLVSVQAAAGWDIDRLEVESLLDSALMSVCGATTTAQLDLAAWLEVEIARAGGDVPSAWRRAGKRASAVKDLVELDRIRQVLLAAIDAAPADCPYWAEGRDDFRGRQISLDRWQLSFGGGGKAIAVAQGGARDLNFGGAGRALLGRTFGTAHGLYVGGEVGASASFPRDDAGERGALRLGLDLVVPVVYRRTFLTTYVEAEAGYLVHGTEPTENMPTELDHGFHVGAAFGARSTRKRLVFPGVALGASYERTFGDGDTPPLHMFKLGMRVAIDWDL
jgi:hypothetical protein